jgi:hypothetical protein
MSNVHHGALPFASSERSASPREGLSGSLIIPRMIDPLSEGFDPARRALLFSRGILACCAFESRVELNCPNLATSESAICAHFAKQAETSIAFGDCGG